MCQRNIKLPKYKTNAFDVKMGFLFVFHCCLRHVLLTLFDDLSKVILIVRAAVSSFSRVNLQQLESRVTRTFSSFEFSLSHYERQLRLGPRRRWGCCLSVEVVIALMDT